MFSTQSIRDSFIHIDRMLKEPISIELNATINVCFQVHTFGIMWPLKRVVRFPKHWYAIKSLFMKTWHSKMVLFCAMKWVSVWCVCVTYSLQRLAA